MVARKAPRPRRKRKWRFHCSTCGEPFEHAQLYAYCSKDCERDRRGRNEPPPMREEAVDGYLDLARRLESAMPFERKDILARMAELQRDREAPVMHAGIPDDDTRAESWALRIRPAGDRLEAAHRRSVRLGIQLGDLLLDAKAALAHGEFGRLFRDHKRPAFGALPFSRRWGQRLMALAANPYVSDAKHASHLPGDVDACYLLTRLDDADLSAAIESGAVHGEMTRDDVRRLLPHPDEEEVSDDEMLERMLARSRARLLQFIGQHPDLAEGLVAGLGKIMREARQAARQGGQ